MKDVYIRAVMWMYGMTKKEAQRYCASCSKEVLEEIRRSYLSQSTFAFYND